jgi:hypothetical protein
MTDQALLDEFDELLMLGAERHGRTLKNTIALVDWLTENGRRLLAMARAGDRSNVLFGDVP